MTAFNMQKNSPPVAWRAVLGCRKSPTGLFDRFLQSAARIICPPMANKFHTCSLISIFAQVHALVENGFDFIRRYSGELCEALF